MGSTDRYAACYEHLSVAMAVLFEPEWKEQTVIVRPILEKDERFTCGCNKPASWYIRIPDKKPE